MRTLLLALALAAPDRLPVTPDSSAHAAPQVSGTVTDSAGAPIADARLILTELHRTTTSSTAGRFTFPAVIPGHRANHQTEGVRGGASGTAGHRQS
jgi:hypothetical protein